MKEQFNKIDEKRFDLLEAKIESLIASKLDDKLQAISTINESFIKQTDTLDKISQSYAGTVTQSSQLGPVIDFRKGILESKK